MTNGMPLAVKTNQVKRKQPPMSRFTRTVLTLLVADCLLILFITFGYVFPDRLQTKQPGEAMPNIYDLLREGLATPATTGTEAGYRGRQDCGFWAGPLVTSTRVPVSRRVSPDSATCSPGCTPSITSTCSS